MDIERLQNGLALVLAEREAQGWLSNETLALLPDDAKKGVRRLQQEVIAADFANLRDSEMHAEKMKARSLKRVSNALCRHEQLKSIYDSLPARLKVSKSSAATHLHNRWSDYFSEGSKPLSVRQIRKLL